jgi:AraC-like DNA-binding protein
MRHFYRRALLAFVLILVADALIAGACFHLSRPSYRLLPRKEGASPWRLAAITDTVYGGGSTLRLHEASPGSLSFDFKLSTAAHHPSAWAALLAGGPGPHGSVDLSAYNTVTFTARCAPANALIFNVTTLTQRPGKPSWMPAMTYFSCNEKGAPVSLDLTRLTIPGWWHEAEQVDISYRSYRLDRVIKWEFGASQFSPRALASHVEISDITLHGRDDRYLIALAVILVSGWIAFGVWFFRAQSRALIAQLDSRLEKDLSFVAYRQLTVEPFEDQDKASILRFIATNYADPGLDLDSVTAGTGANRNKINEVLQTELGMTFTSYLRKLRLTEAARLLNDNGTATVAEVAHSVGYPNSSYFNKLFREEYGCTAKQFRHLAGRRGPPE